MTKRAKLQELFEGITQSKQKVSRITESGNFWRISFANRQLSDMYITCTKAKDIANEIKTYTQGVRIMTMDQLLNSLLDERDVALRKLQATQNSLKEVINNEITKC